MGDSNSMQADASVRTGKVSRPRIWAAKLDYFELAPERWHAALATLVGFGFTHVDVRIPWGLHDRGAGKYEFGEGQPQLHVRRFLEHASELGLGLCVRIGPRQERSVDLSCDGLPERVVWAPECQAQSRSGNAVVVPRWTGSFAEPSIFSEAYEQHCVEWLGAVAREVGPLLAANASILVLDSERSAQMLYTRPDYRAKALSRFLAFATERYPDPERFAQVWPDEHGPHQLEPPTRPVWDGGNPTAWSEWFDFVDGQLDARAQRFARVLRQAGLPDCAVARVFRASRRGLLDEIELRVERAGLVTPIAQLACGFELADRSRAAPDETLLQAIGQGHLDFSLGPVLPRAGHVGSLLDEAGNPTPTGERLRWLLQRLGYLRDSDVRRDACALVLLPQWLLHGFRQWEVWPGSRYHTLSPVGDAAPTSPGAADVVSVEQATAGASAASPTVPTRAQLLGIVNLLATLRAGLERRRLGCRFIDAGADVSTNDCWMLAPSLEHDSDAPATNRPHFVAQTAAGASGEHRRDATLDNWLSQLASSVPHPSSVPDGVRIMHFSAASPTAQKSSNIQSRVIVLTNSNDTDVVLRLQCPDTRARDTNTGELVQPIEGRLDLSVPAGTVRVLELQPTVGPGDLDRNELAPG